MSQFGVVYKYNGTGNAAYLTTVPQMGGIGPVDLIADCQGNFYVYCNTASASFFRKYDPSGALLQSWTTSNPNNLVAHGDGGLAVLSNKLYYDIQFGTANNKIVSCTVGSAAVSIDSIRTGSISLVDDMGSCAGFGLSLPTITVTPSGNNVCAGTTVTFTASSTLGGNAPKYQWRVNNAKVGANDTSYTYVPGNGDTVTCTMMSSSYCVSQVEVANAPVVMHVLPIVTPAVTIRASDTGIIRSFGNIQSDRCKNRYSHPFRLFKHQSRRNYLFRNPGDLKCLRLIWRRISGLSMDAERRAAFNYVRQASLHHKRIKQ